MPGYTYTEFEALCKKYDRRCLCCGRPGSEIVLEPDHIVPLAKGGNDDISNIQPLCRSCNARKHILIVDFRPRTNRPTFVAVRGSEVYHFLRLDDDRTVCGLSLSSPPMRHPPEGHRPCRKCEWDLRRLVLTPLAGQQREDNIAAYISHEEDAERQ